ncbi:hypothetical protein APY94_03980 [Thermococcus celericrescens]|uniref:PEGA domain-containing protein n=1 Tax=Thermococcus celericrescens TaxID=227598 RepID=A0A117ITG1_9EURY|nr:hypothetical protein APY94_03980 [Thermococcus celericrescens]
MKKTAVLLALLVLGSLLAVGTGQVSALTVTKHEYVGPLSYETFPVVVWINSTLASQYGLSSAGWYLFGGSRYSSDRVTITIDGQQLTLSPQNNINRAYWFITSNKTIGDVYLGDTKLTKVVAVAATETSISAGGTKSIYTTGYLWVYGGSEVSVEGIPASDTSGLRVLYVESDAGNIAIHNSDSQYTHIVVYLTGYPLTAVTFHFSDGLTGQALSGVTVKEGDSTLGTLNDGDTLELPVSQHTLTFEKSGYWSTTATVDVQNDTSLSVVMYPSSAAFKFENFPESINILENTIYTLTFTLSPITTDAAYNTYLSISGLTSLLEVQKDGSTISPESGKYYLGDISSPVQVSIKFKAGAVGQHGFTLSVESHDAIMSKTYTTTKQVTYTVEPLPFSVQMPQEWQVGQNELRISESSGQSYLITAVLKDSSGNEVWSDSHAFSPYEAYSFSVNVPSEGAYTLELQWNGQTASYDVTVNPAISLTTKTLTVEKGGEGTIVLHFKNPSSSVQYYTIKVSGGFLPSEINQSISVAPLTEKDVSIAFAVPEDLTYDAYELNVQVLQGNATVFQDKVAVSISDSGGFSLLGGGSSGNTWLWIGAGGLGLLTLIALARRR